MNIQLEPPDQKDVMQLIAELDEYQKPLYPAESFHGIDLAALKQPNVLFAVARTAEGQAVGCGAIVVGPEYGEIKRMFVTPAARGTGVGRNLLAFLEDAAKVKGCTTFVLETGYLQSEALALYERKGYTKCGPFGSYSEDPNSVFMRKTI